MPSFRSRKPPRPAGHATARRLVACWLIAIAAPLSAAETGSAIRESAEPNSADTPPAPDPAAYESPLAGYRKFQAQPVEAWPLANQTVGEIGGWRTYGMEIHRDRQRHEAGEQR